jgi:outer membrane protein
MALIIYRVSRLKPTAVGKPTLLLVSNFDIINFALLLRARLKEKKAKPMQAKAILLFFGVVFGITMNAQRFGIVDSEKILTQIPDYTDAQQQLDQLSRSWEREIQALMSEANALRDDYEAEKVLLTEEMKEERLKAIEEKQEEAKKKQQLYFGAKGKIYTKRQELIKPIQDKIFNAVQEVARRQNLDAVFDKGNGLVTLYISERVDISDKVLDKLNSNRK